MDRYSIRLMEDIVFEAREKSKTNSSKSQAKNTDLQSHIKDKQKSEDILSHLKVPETLTISKESEKKLFDILKDIHGINFKLINFSKFNKNTDIGRQYWLEQVGNVITGVTNFSSAETEQKTNKETTREYYISLLKTYNFHASHSAEALIHTHGDLYTAIELLFCEYYKDIKKLSKRNIIDGLDLDDLLRRREKEREELKIHCGDSFKTIKPGNNIWLFNVKLDYLIENDKNEEVDCTLKSMSNDTSRLINQEEKCAFETDCKTDYSNVTEDSMFTLEIRFPEDCKYPYEPPHYFFYKSSGTYTAIKCLKIAERLYLEALKLCGGAEPFTISVLSLLNNEEEIKTYLLETKENFPNPVEPIGFQLQETIKQNIDIKSNYMEIPPNFQYFSFDDKKYRLLVRFIYVKALEMINTNQVSIIFGPIGCGKSTEIPQYILEDWLKNESRQSNEKFGIISAHPRKMCTITIAERAIAEQRETLRYLIGYKVKFKSTVTSKTRLTFCTTDILLQKLCKDPELKYITHVIVDQVHERNAESDFLLMCLKQLCILRKDLKIILISSSPNVDIFYTYFGKVPILEIVDVYHGYKDQVTQKFLEDILEEMNYNIEEDSKYARNIKGGWEQLNKQIKNLDVKKIATNRQKHTGLDEDLTFPQIVRRYSKYSLRVKKNMYVMNPEKINFDLIEKTIEWIVDSGHKYQTRGALLVFLPGIDEITIMENILKKNVRFLNCNKHEFQIMSLHANSSTAERTLIHKEYNRYYLLRIILTTDIAESSFAIYNVTMVIDAGKIKDKKFNLNVYNMKNSDLCWISKANALQRMSRINDTFGAFCIHLYSSFRFKYHMLDQPICEISKIPLDLFILRLKLIRKNKKMDIHLAFENMLEPPPRENVSSAIKRLQDIGALNPECTLTPLGHYLAALSIDVRIGKLILFGTIFSCVDSALTIAAFLCHKSPFIDSIDKKQEVNAKKKEYATGDSDLLTSLTVYKKWQEIYNDKAKQAFVNENFLCLQTLQILADIKHKLLDSLVSIRFITKNELIDRSSGEDRVLDMTYQIFHTNNNNYKLLQGLLGAALFSHLVKKMSSESYNVLTGKSNPEEFVYLTKDNDIVQIHPSSLINFNTSHDASPFLVYKEQIKKGTLIFIKEVTVAPTLSLALLSGYGIDIIEIQNDNCIISLGNGWTTFAVESLKVAQLLQYTRIEFMKLLRQVLDPQHNIVPHFHRNQIINIIVQIITNDG